MLVLDNNLLSDYLDGTETARRFLMDYEREGWAVSTIVLYEAYMGCVHGYIDAAPEQVGEAITSSISVLDVTERTAREAKTLQQSLLKQGMPVDHPDALIAASAREHGGTFATAEKQFWRGPVNEHLQVAKYDPY